MRKAFAWIWVWIVISFLISDAICNGNPHCPLAGKILSFIVTMVTGISVIILFDKP